MCAICSSRWYIKVSSPVRIKKGIIPVDKGYDLGFPHIKSEGEAPPHPTFRPTVNYKTKPPCYLLNWGQVFGLL